MKPHHITEVRTALEPLAYGEPARIDKGKMRLWTGYKRLRENAWRELAEFLPRSVRPNQLSVFENTTYYLIYPEGKSWSLGSYIS